VEVLLLVVEVLLVEVWSGAPASLLPIVAWLFSRFSFLANGLIVWTCEEESHLCLATHS